MPHPPGQSVHIDFTWENSPVGGTGTQGQFCVQMAMSSVDFQGSGVAFIPAAPPTINAMKCLLFISIVVFP
jgi:hypothetical protein